jgi:hypothetical protein
LGFPVVQFQPDVIVEIGYLNSGLFCSLIKKHGTLVDFLFHDVELFLDDLAELVSFVD